MWTLDEAQALVAQLEPVIPKLDYHSLLGGSVLHKGQSEDDLDLWFFPLNGYESNIPPVYDVLEAALGPLRPIRDSPDYKAGEPYYVKEMLMGSWMGKRVDLFIL